MTQAIKKIERIIDATIATSTIEVAPLNAGFVDCTTQQTVSGAPTLAVADHDIQRFERESVLTKEGREDLYEIITKHQNIDYYKYFQHFEPRKL